MSERRRTPTWLEALALGMFAMYVLALLDLPSPL
jgi:hypothetical protein